MSCNNEEQALKNKEMSNSLIKNEMMFHRKFLHINS